MLSHYGLPHAPLFAEFVPPPAHDARLSRPAFVVEAPRASRHAG